MTSPQSAVLKALVEDKLPKRLWELSGGMLDAVFHVHVHDGVLTRMTAAENGYWAAWADIQGIARAAAAERGPNHDVYDGFVSFLRVDSDTPDGFVPRPEVPRPGGFTIASYRENGIRLESSSPPVTHLQWFMHRSLHSELYSPPYTAAPEAFTAFERETRSLARYLSDAFGAFYASKPGVLWPCYNRAPGSYAILSCPHPAAAGAGGGGGGGSSSSSAPAACRATADFAVWSDGGSATGYSEWDWRAVTAWPEFADKHTSSSSNGRPPPLQPPLQRTCVSTGGTNAMSAALLLPPSPPPASCAGSGQRRCGGSPAGECCAGTCCGFRCCPVTWHMLALILASTDLMWRPKGSQQRHRLVCNMTQQQLGQLRAAAAALPAQAAALSEGLLAVQVEVKVAGAGGSGSGALTSLTTEDDGASGYFLAPADVKAQVLAAAHGRQYDAVILIYRADYYPDAPPAAADGGSDSEPLPNPYHKPELPMLLPLYAPIGPIEGGCCLPQPAFGWARSPGFMSVAAPTEWRWPYAPVSPQGDRLMFMFADVLRRFYEEASLYTVHLPDRYWALAQPPYGYGYPSQQDFLRDFLTGRVTPSTQRPWEVPGMNASLYGYGTPLKIQNTIWQQPA
ncbi:hypothetical protein HXX76_008164 [Chlamydomonas incerta]|uniref:Uncharacterized protein n=1 Tax=Chlamydomonas incerta TaxID=51695 RepID=A0A835T916_CHLIN|nr:hypothetical protein HXX76_008164 [Chlamydomonas incerta]|eukprot:KAG2433806.1 hypothetical protein HXX76_008164 [Chlamydomonas incerta]